MTLCIKSKYLKALLWGVGVILTVFVMMIIVDIISEVGLGNVLTFLFMWFVSCNIVYSVGERNNMPGMGLFFVIIVLIIGCIIVGNAVYDSIMRYLAFFFN
jgi:hypothetical protein